MLTKTAAASSADISAAARVCLGRQKIAPAIGDLRESRRGQRITLDGGPPPGIFERPLEPVLRLIEKLSVIEGPSRKQEQLRITALLPQHAPIRQRPSNNATSHVCRASATARVLREILKATRRAPL